jgi:hypothetical protein
MLMSVYGETRFAIRSSPEGIAVVCSTSKEPAIECVGVQITSIC